MGWLFCHQSRASLIQERIQPWEGHQTIAHAVCLNTLWTVNEYNGKRYIGCCLLRKSDDEWGYKDMCEEVHPYYYDCPLKFLDMVPTVACQVWRDKVKEYHANRTRKFHLGEVLTLRACKIPSMVVTSVKPLRGTYQGITYRVPKQLIV